MRRGGALLAALAAAPAVAQVPAIDGDWDGGIRVPAGMTLPLALHFHDGKATLDSPDQGVAGAPVTFTREGAKIVVTMSASQAVLTTTLAADGQSLDGALVQGGMTLPAHFAHRAAGAPAPEPKRPQTPHPPFPYAVADVKFPSRDGTLLAGTVTRPEGTARVPGIVLIAGSGPQARDEVVSGHRIFLVLADRLTRAGYAVLRYDKRGIGGSAGHYAQATESDFIADADAAARWLATRPGIDPKRVGLIGHSEGAELAPEVMRIAPNLAFAVLLSAPGERGDKVVASQKSAIETAMGVPPATVAAGAANEAAVLGAVIDAPDAATAKARVMALEAERHMPPDQAARIAEEASSPAFRMLLAHDPVPALRELKRPVLVMAGSKDLQVLPDRNLPPIRAALAGNAHAKIIELPGLNHLLQPAKTGTPAEYGQIETTIDPQVLDLIVDWLKATLGR